MSKKRFSFNINISETEREMINDLQKKYSINVCSLLRLAIHARWKECETIANKKK